jgi:hypothetical protein
MYPQTEEEKLEEASAVAGRGESRTTRVAVKDLV